MGVRDAPEWVSLVVVTGHYCGICVCLCDVGDGEDDSDVVVPVLLMLW